MNIDPIIKSTSEMTVSAEDLTDFREYFDQEFIVVASLQHELYRQGYRDCIKLLTMLGLLAGDGITYTATAGDFDPIGG